jgi:ribonuclease HII
VFLDLTLPPAPPQKIGRGERKYGVWRHHDAAKPQSLFSPSFCFPKIMRTNPDTSFEQALWAAGVEQVAGVDEAGRGAWAGPVSAGAVILPPHFELMDNLAGVRDSKQMTPRQRAQWVVKICAAALAWGVGMATAEEIDALGIVPATRLAMQRALAQLQPPAQHLLVDALRLPQNNLPQQALIKGDARVLSIAAASVLAKTARDALMVELAQQYPGYGLERHKGYGTAAHQAALLELGPSPIHRKTFAPVRKLLISPNHRDTKTQRSKISL